MSCKRLATHSYLVLRAKIKTIVNMFKKLFVAIRGNLKNLDVRPEKRSSTESVPSFNSKDSFKDELEKSLPIIDVDRTKKYPIMKPKVQRDYSKNNYQAIRVEIRNMDNEIIDTHYDAYRVYSTGERRHVNDATEIKWVVSQTFKRRKH